jgi:hypothetical protein
MRTRSYALAAAVLLVFGAADASAGELLPAGTAAASSVEVAQSLPDRSLKPPSGRGNVDSSSRLFGQFQRLSGQKPKVVCGMTLIPADPRFDPNIREKLPTSGPKPIIGAVTPPMCAGEANLRLPMPPTLRK